MKHWIRDCRIDVNSGGVSPSGKGEGSYLIHHFLRVGGWTPVFECDGDQDNHVADGSMEAAGITNWTEGGGLSGSAKSTSDAHMGSQSLSIQPTGTGQHITGANIASLLSGEDYQVTVWVKMEEVGTSLEVQINPGTGSYSVLGTISGVAASGWRRFDYSFTESGGGNANLRFNNTGSSPASPFLIDTVFMYRSWFEYAGVEQDYIGTTDGEILNDDEFSSTAYTFVVGDIDKFIVTWDTTNLGNSGVYRILGVSGGNAQLDLRAGGTPALTSQANLPWRLLDGTKAPRLADGITTGEKYCGWVLESPHTEKWRYGLRNNFVSSSDSCFLGVKACPYDGDIDVDTGEFMADVVGLHNYAGYYSKGGYGTAADAPPTHGYFLRGQAAINTSTHMRVNLITDDDGSFVWPLLRPGDGNGEDKEASGFTGFTSSDAQHTLRQSFVHFSPCYAFMSEPDLKFVGYTTGYQYFAYYGCQCSSVGSGWMVRSTIMVLGFGDGTDDEIDLGTNYRINPFDSKYWTRYPRIARDYFGTDTTNPSEKDMEDVGMRFGVTKDDTTQEFTSIDSDSWMYIRHGIYFELPGGFELLT